VRRRWKDVAPTASRDFTRWETREELRPAIVVWIETRYNRRRRQRALGKLTPVEFEMI
jgi:putative transposase